MEKQSDTPVIVPQQKSLWTIILHDFFSVKGCVGRFDYMGIICILNIILDGVLKLKIMVLDICICGAFFYMSLVAIQRRCRDMGLKGTFFILLFSLLYPVIFYSKYIRIHPVVLPDNWKIIASLIIFVFFVYHLILLLFPGKEKKNMELICPLLRHPFIYTGVCLIFYFLAFYVVFLQYPITG